MRGRNQNQSTGKSGRGCVSSESQHKTHPHSLHHPPTLPCTTSPKPPIPPPLHPLTHLRSTSSLPSHTTHLHHHRITNTTNHTTTTNRLCAPTEQAPLTFNVGYNIYRACPIISLSLLNCLFAVIARFTPEFVLSPQEGTFDQLSRERLQLPTFI